MIPPSTTITPEGKRTRRILLWIGALIIGLNLLVWLVGRFATEGGTHGPDGSTYVTTPRGAAAVEGVLRRLGFDTGQVRVPLDEAALDPGGTLVLIDVGEAAYTASEMNAIDSFVREGGRLLVVGRATIATGLFADPPTWRSAGASLGRLIAGEAEGGTIPLAGFGSLVTTEADEPFLVAGDGTVIGAFRPHGEGVFVWLADSHPFHNQGIGQPGAAPTVVEMIDPLGPVLFDELRHGFSEGGGVWAVIPPGVRTTFLLAGATLVLGLAAYGRRLGPPYDTERRLPPGREIFLDSVAGILTRSSARREAVSVLRDEARRRLLERGGTGDLHATGRAAGLDDPTLASVLGDGANDDDLVAADRAIATLTQTAD